MMSPNRNPDTSTLPVLPAVIALLLLALVGWGPALAQTAPDLPAVVPGQVTESSGGLVVSEHPEASRAGRDVLAAGGNAVDAAIATGFALAVTHPAAGNIGGGGFMVIRFPDGRTTALDFREKAPLASHPLMWLGEDGQYSREVHHYSHEAVGVPGTVAGFDKAHRLYGEMNWERLVYPAVVLADDGFELSERLAWSLSRFVERNDHPATIQAFSKNGVPYGAGEVFRQPDLARTLGRIMRGRRAGFYEGETARLVVAEMERGGGLITEKDLDVYEARERAPVTGVYRGYRVIGMPPPSSGGVATVEMLNILEGFDLAAMGHNTARSVHHLVEAMRRAYRDRARYLADPDFVDVPLHHLTSKEYGDTLRGTIHPRRADVSDPDDVDSSAATTYESPQTTHFSVVDQYGMAVSVTYTLEQGFGSGITVPGAGFLLNNEMGDFNAGPGLTTEGGLIGTDPNLARPEQRMLSSMSPTILAKDGELVAVIGSPGGRTIINTVLQLVVNLVDHRMPPADVVAAPRVHHQWLPDVVTVEEGGLSEATVERLREMGHTVRVRGRQGLAHSIFIDPATGRGIGVPDPRNPDAAAAGR